MEAIKETHFNFRNQTGFYKGKVRDVYYFPDRLVMVATDRISAFDVVLPRAIPYKGQVLNQIASYFLRATSDIIPNWVTEVPDPMVAMGHLCQPYKVEMVIRGYLAGHAWREYKAGKRMICGVSMPDGLQENDPFPEPIITPTTKADHGHDLDISRDDIISQGLVPAKEYTRLEDYTRKLFDRGTAMAAARGLILVDTKYEFGVYNGQAMLMDEIHTPDSSRYFYKEGYQDRQTSGQAQKQLSKEFVRQWLIANGFQGLEGQQIPKMPDEWVTQVSERYIELYEHITGEKFEKPNPKNLISRIQQNIELSLSMPV